MKKIILLLVIIATISLSKSYAYNYTNYNVNRFFDTDVVQLPACQNVYIYLRISSMSPSINIYHTAKAGFNYDGHSHSLGFPSADHNEFYSVTYPYTVSTITLWTYSDSPYAHAVASATCQYQ